MKRYFTHELTRRILRAIVRDSGRKLLALFLALGLYFAVSYRLGKTESLRLPNVPVEIVLPDGVVNVDAQVPPVELTVTGRPKKLKVISSRDVTARVKIPAGSFVPGSPYELKLSPEDFRVPTGARILDLEPREIFLNLEPLVTKRIRVEPRYDSLDRLSPDYKIDSTVCAPSEVSVTGPASRVNELRQVATRPIPLDQTVNESFDYHVDLRPIEDLTLTPSRVGVRINVQRKYSSRNFRNLPLAVFGPPEQRAKFQVTLPEKLAVEVAVTGPETVLGQLQNLNLRPYLDIGGLREAGSFDLVPNCMIVGIDDSELKVRMIRPDRVTVTVTPRQ